MKIIKISKNVGLKSRISDIDTLSEGISGHLGQIASLFGLSADIQMNISLLILGVGRSNFTGRGSLASVFGKLIYFLSIPKNVLNIFLGE